MKYVYYVFAGLVSGVVGGMGMGGGTLLIPLLTLFGKIPQHAAQAINLISFIPMAAVTVALHAKNKLLEVNKILYVILPGIAFAACYAYIAGFVEGKLLARIFGGFLIALSFLQFFADKLVKK